ncbi:hypothetical protein EGW08_011673 [Elysia chlorotica]|uniref:Uncharacterized protein n=1 Tax=Elysia chlorotica TaxID=188477 RepID=A0A3S1A1W6_ELYCH|nr:hypothetical protein EGW08_011673 [Elysia chlorotica]
MEYCLPHAVLALLQEEASAQIPKSYFVRSGTHSTKITLVYRRRKRKSAKESPLACLSPLSSQSSQSAQTPSSLYGAASSAGSRRLTQGLQNSLHRSVSVTEAGGYHDNNGPGGYHDSKGPGGYHDNKGPGGYHDSKGPGGYHDSKGPGGYHDSKGPGGYHDSKGPGGYHDNKGPGGYHDSKGPGGYHGRQEASTRDFRGGKVARSILSASDDSSSSSSTEDYSSLDKNRDLRHQQPQTQLNAVASTDRRHHQQEAPRTQLSGQATSDKRRNLHLQDGQRPKEKDDRESSLAFGKAKVAEGTLTHWESPYRQGRTPPADSARCLATSPVGGRRVRSDSQTSRRTCVSSPGRGYGDSARVRGTEDPRTRGFSRTGARTDPRRDSLSPRGGVDLCGNFRNFDRSSGELHERQEHLSISHSSSPRSDVSAREDGHIRGNHPRLSGGNTLQKHASEKDKVATRDPQPPRTDTYSSGREGRGTNLAVPDCLAPCGFNAGHVTPSRSPRPPTPGASSCAIYHGPSPTPCLSPAHRHNPAHHLSPAHRHNSAHHPSPVHRHNSAHHPSPVHRHSPAHIHNPAHHPSSAYRVSPAHCHSQTTVEYDDSDNAHASRDISPPPPTPRMLGCPASEDPVESFNSSVRLRLGAHIT